MGSPDLSLRTAIIAHLCSVLRQAESLVEAAKVLDIDTATLWRMRRRYGIDRRGKLTETTRKKRYDS